MKKRLKIARSGPEVTGSEIELLSSLPLETSGATTSLQWIFLCADAARRLTSPTRKKRKRTRTTTTQMTTMRPSLKGERTLTTAKTIKATRTMMMLLMTIAYLTCTCPVRAQKDHRPLLLEEDHLILARRAMPQRRMMKGPPPPRTPTSLETTIQQQAVRGPAAMTSPQRRNSDLPPRSEPKWVRFESLTRQAAFKRIGQTPTSSFTAVMAVRISLPQLEGELQSFVLEMVKDETELSRIRRRIQAEADLLFTRLQDLQSLLKDEERWLRSVDFLSLLVGASNMWLHHRTEERLDHADAAIRATAHVVDLLTEKDKEIITTIQSLNRQVLRISAQEMDAFWQDAWEEQKSRTEAAITVVQAGLQSRLQPSIGHLVEVKSIWREMCKKLESEKWKVQLNSHFQLFQLRANILVEGETTVIAVHVPVIREHVQWLDLFQLNVRRPFLLGSTMVRVEASSQTPLVLGVSKDQKTFTLATREELARSIKLGDSYFHSQPWLIQFRADRECLAALFLKDNETKAHGNLCPLSKVHGRALVSGPNELVVDTRGEDLDVTARCGEQRLETRTITGMFVIQVSPGCILSSRLWKFTANRKEPREDFIMRSAERFLPAEEKSQTDGDLKLPEWGPLEEKVDDYLSSSVNPWLWIMLTLAALAFLTTAGFIIFLYYKARGASLLEAARSETRILLGATEPKEDEKKNAESAKEQTIQ